MSIRGKESYIIAIDAGGTMTDAVIIDNKGNFEVGKYRTFRHDESESYMGSVKAVAEKLGKNSREIHENCDVSVYAGTAMTNTLLTHDGNKVGLIITRGQKDMPFIENGLTYIGYTQAQILHQQLRRHTTPLVTDDCVCEVSERVTGGSYFGDVHLPEGTILIPLNEKEVNMSAEKLIDKGVDVIGIMFLNSHVFPDHEKRAKDIVESVIKKRGTNTKVVMSHEIAPVGKDLFRLKSLLVQCFAAEKTRVQLEYVEKAAKKDGYKNELLTLLSFGGAVNIRYPRLYETIISGPIGGLTTAKEIAKLIDEDKMVVGDVGGTSYDVGLVIDKRIELRPDSDFAKHRLALPMVELNSAPLGMGTEVKVDNYGNLVIGPESAGYLIGICADYGNLTITDLQVVLGYIAPDSFLGGKIILDRDKAFKEVEKIGKKMGIKDPYIAAEGFLEVFFTHLREFTRTAIESKGYSLGSCTLLLGGGGGLTNMHGIAIGNRFKEIITTPFGSALSAYGVGCADLVHRYNKGIVAMIPSNVNASGKIEVLQSLAASWQELVNKAYDEFKLEGIAKENIKILKGVFMRYAGQLESFETKLYFDVDAKEESTMDKIIKAFEDEYERKFPSAAKFSEAGYAVTQVFIEAIAPKVMPVIRKQSLSNEKPDSNAVVGHRKVFHRGQWEDFTLYELNKLKAGNIVKGPAIIFDDISTIPVGKGDLITFDEYRFLHYKSAVN